jgi:hypothetical protein
MPEDAGYLPVFCGSRRAAGYGYLGEAQIEPFAVGPPLSGFGPGIFPVPPRCGFGHDLRDGAPGYLPGR